MVAPIVVEVREAREALFAEADYDIHEFCRRLIDRQAASGRPVVKRDIPSASFPGELAKKS